MRQLLFATMFASLAFTSAPSVAATLETDAFLANVRVNSAFVAGSGKLAGDRTENNGLRTFSSRETSEQEAILTALEQRNVPLDAQSLPMNVASNDLVTGRSAAVAPRVSAETFSSPVGTGALMPAALLTLDHLTAAKGDAFDTLYKASQINALRQLSALYNAYSMTGDETGLRQLAKTELAATDRAIADLGRF